jgi:hypothetical protein
MVLTTDQCLLQHLCQTSYCGKLVQGSCDLSRKEIVPNVLPKCVEDMFFFHAPGSGDSSCPGMLIVGSSKAGLDMTQA